MLNSLCASLSNHIGMNLKTEIISPLYLGQLFLKSLPIILWTS